MEDAFIRIRNLKKIYKMGDEYIHALDGIDLDIKKGDIICLWEHLDQASLLY